MSAEGPDKGSWIKRTRDIELYIAIIAFVFVVIVTFLFVVTRYVYSVSLPSLEELTVVVFIWFLYFAMAYRYTYFLWPTLKIVTSW